MSILSIAPQNGVGPRREEKLKLTERTENDLENWSKNLAVQKKSVEIKFNS
jgi:hypothetical protein